MYNNFNKVDSLVQTFIGKEDTIEADLLKRENSNFVYSLPLLRKNISNLAEEDYLMNHIFSKELVRLYDDGIVYIHDKQLSSYCLSVGCKDIATMGVPTLAKNMIASKPTKRLRKILRHFSNVVVLMSQQVSGACMLSQMTTILASYLKYEEVELGYKWSNEELEEEIQSLIWELNMPLRSGSESSFSNITLEFGKPSEEIKDDYVVIGGEMQLYKYKDIEGKYFDRINKAIIDVMAKGTGTIPFTFPLITVTIDDDFKYDNKLFLYLLDKMYRWGGVYFENFRTEPFKNEKYTSVNKRIKPRDPEVSRSLCCRLNIDLSLLSKVGAGIFGSSTGNTGAVQVLTLNIARIMIEFKNNKKLMFDKIKEYMEIMQEGHNAKRKFIEDNKELYPTFFAYNTNLKNYFNVFGLGGMHEGLINMGYKNGINDKDGKILAHEIMEHISTIIDEFIVRDKVACGLEYAPMEGASVKLGRKIIKWANENNIECDLQGKEGDEYITSGCMTPFAEDDFIKQVENASEFQGYATSGSILHHFIEAKIEPKKLAEYIEKIFRKPIIYITLSPTVTACMSCGQQIPATDAKDIEICPVCQSDDLATFQRVIGYTKAISRKKIKVNKDGVYEGEYNFWSNAKRHDWSNRKRFKEDSYDKILQQDN